MVKKQFLGFIFKWLISSIAMYVCINLFGKVNDGGRFIASSWWFYALAGLVYALVNTILKPLVTLFALPVLVVTLGLFTIIINMLMVAVTIWIMPDVGMSFWGVFFSCIVISLINFLVNLAVPSVK